MGRNWSLGSDWFSGGSRRRWLEASRRRFSASSQGTVHPHVTVKAQEEVALAQQILQDAHDNCLISNSIVAQVKISPDFRVATAAE